MAASRTARWVISTVAALLCVAAGPALSGVAHAAACGGGVACRCGDTVTSSYALVDDLGPCAGNGLVVASDVELDCRGHRITGSGSASDKFGIFLNGKPDAPVRRATVRSCRVTGFLRGIRLRSATANTIVNNVASGNGDPRTHEGYGIDLSGGSYNNLLEGNRVEGNADEGIHVGTGSFKNRFVANVSRDNHREALYLLAADGNEFVRNTLGGGVNSLYLKDSSGNLFEGNTFVDRPARIIGAARDNRFVENTFSGAWIHFTPYKGATSRAPTNNRIIGGSITSASQCLRFTSSRGNVVVDTALRECRTAVRAESPHGPSDNSVIGTVPGSLELDEGSSLDVGRQVRVQVRNPGGAPVAGAEVQGIDVTGKTQFTALTDEGGMTAPQIVVTSTRTRARTTDRMPLQLTVTKAGYGAETRAVSVIDGSPLPIVLQPQ